MMLNEKNWLIRTRAKQILGPVSKKKVIEFLEKGSLAAEDEITKGNGFWIFIKEKDMLEKYLYGDAPMEFNPVSEAKAVLAKNRQEGRTSFMNNSKEHTLSDENHKEEKLPDQGDLVYPDSSNNDQAEVQKKK